MKKRGKNSELEYDSRQEQEEERSTRVIVGIHLTLPQPRNTKHTYAKNANPRPSLTAISNLLPLFAEETKKK